MQRKPAKPAEKKTLEFTVGPRNVLVVFDAFPNRLIARAIIHNGERVDRAKQPELWDELRDDFLYAYLEHHALSTTDDHITRITNRLRRLTRYD